MQVPDNFFYDNKSAASEAGKNTSSTGKTGKRLYGQVEKRGELGREEERTLPPSEAREKREGKSFQEVADGLEKRASVEEEGGVSELFSLFSSSAKKEKREAGAPSLFSTENLTEESSGGRSAGILEKGIFQKPSSTDGQTMGSGDSGRGSVSGKSIEKELASHASSTFFPRKEGEKTEEGRVSEGVVETSISLQESEEKERVRRDLPLRDLSSLGRKMEGFGANQISERESADRGELASRPPPLSVAPSSEEGRRSDSLGERAEAGLFSSQGQELESAQVTERRGVEVGTGKDALSSSRPASPSPIPTSGPTEGSLLMGGVRRGTQSKRSDLLVRPFDLAADVHRPSAHEEVQRTSSEVGLPSTVSLGTSSSGKSLHGTNLQEFPASSTTTPKTTLDKSSMKRGNEEEGVLPGGVGEGRRGGVTREVKEEKRNAPVEESPFVAIEAPTSSEKGSSRTPAKGVVGLVQKEGAAEVPLQGVVKEGRDLSSQVKERFPSRSDSGLEVERQTFSGPGFKSGIEPEGGLGDVSIRDRTSSFPVRERANPLEKSSVGKTKVSEEGVSDVALPPGADLGRKRSPGESLVSGKESWVSEGESYVGGQEKPLDKGAVRGGVVPPERHEGTAGGRVGRLEESSVVESAPHARVVPEKEARGVDVPFSAVSEGSSPEHLVEREREGEEVSRWTSKVDVDRRKGIEGREGEGVVVSPSRRELRSSKEESKGLETVSSQGATMALPPIVLSGKVPAEVEKMPPLPHRLKEVVDQILRQIYSLWDHGMIETTLILNQPPLFRGVKVSIVLYEQAPKELKISFTNLTRLGKKVMDDHLAMLRAALTMSEQGLVVHQIATSVAGESPPRPFTEETTRQREEEGRASGEGEGSKREQEEHQQGLK